MYAGECTNVPSGSGTAGESSLDHTDLFAWETWYEADHPVNPGVIGMGEGDGIAAIPVVTELPDGTLVIDDCHVLDPNDLCEPGTPATPGTPAITIRDLAAFRPAPTTAPMEPDGWAVVDLPANFLSDASVHTASGTLLGRAADVRFTPTHYRWNFSDATTTESDSPGATWATLGQREFTATPTSRTFAERGTFEVTPWVTYRAEYRLAGGPWIPVAGTLEIPGPTRSILVGRIDTVLTNGDCTQYPTAPGC
ncbi:hypothetical protein ACDF64_07675 [Agromyces sp. MMS24-JH15]|uniref:hypothetical protein n=1 Tax=Agromyces sp. MMS24-JH15 TaxID=3243765 RepID=UPI0037482CF1